MDRFTQDSATAADLDNPHMLRRGMPMSALLNEILDALALVRSVTKDLGASISATTSFLVQCPSIAAVLAAARFVNSTAFATSDTDYWSFTVTNLGGAGSGTTVMLATTNTKATGGALLGANVPRTFGLSATPANLVTAAGDVLQVTLTKSGSPAPLTLASLALDFSFTP